MKNILVLIYGLLSYVIFFFSFLYSIGFVGNIIVTKTIDSGTETALSSSIIINLVLLSVFALQHSIMARPAFKNWFTTIISPAIERSTYVLLSSLALLLLYWKWQPLTFVVWEVKHEVVSMVIVGVFYLGWIIVLLSTFMINHFELFGLSQIYNNLKNRVTSSPKFQTNYFYTIVRHPIMLGFLIAFWAAPVMTMGHLLFSIVTTLYIFIAVKYLEEKDLRNALGKDYKKYQNEVPMIIPFT